MSTLVAGPSTDQALAASLPGGFTSRYAEANGVRLHHVAGGSGDPVLLLGGWPQTWWQWHKVMPALARRYRVIAVDLRGMGASAKPVDGYDKKTMARDIRELVRHLGYDTAHIIGHDIGAMVAYSYAANHPEATAKISLLDVPHPEAGWNDFPLLPGPGQQIDRGPGIYLWWFAFNQVKALPEQLLEGRMRPLIDWLIARLAADPAAIDEDSRQIYARAYSTAEAIRAGNAWYQAFRTDITDAQTYRPVSAPLLGLGGRDNYGYLCELLPAKGTDVTVRKITGSGHYLPEEQPQAVVKALTEFLG